MTENAKRAIRLAMRVLVTLEEQHRCDPQDAIELRRIAGNLQTFGMPLKELACRVIRRERCSLVARQHRLMRGDRNLGCSYRTPLRAEALGHDDV